MRTFTMATLFVAASARLCFAQDADLKVEVLNTTMATAPATISTCQLSLTFGNAAIGAVRLQDFNPVIAAIHKNPEGQVHYLNFTEILKTSCKFSAVFDRAVTKGLWFKTDGVHPIDPVTIIYETHDELAFFPTGVPVGETFKQTYVLTVLGLALPAN
jgi:hypothetical protein